MLYLEAMTGASVSKDRILDSGSNLLSVGGLGGITLGTLADRSGMSKSGLFAHFRSKDELQIQLLQHTAKMASEYVVRPALAAEEGLPRLRSLVERWFGWTRHAGLEGGCPVAAGMFELDDGSGPVRECLLEMETYWRGLLLRLTGEAVEHGHLRRDLDAEQFVWELCGIYLSHHVSLRFVRDPDADARASAAFEALLERALPRARKKSAGGDARRIR